MNEMKVVIHVDTPMFCGRGGNKADTLRQTSLMAALRTAFRLLVADSATSSQELLAVEGQIFGSVADENAGGRGRVRIKPVGPRPKVMTEPLVELNWKPRGSEFKPVGYLVGMGLGRIDQNEYRLNRGYVAPGAEAEFSVKGSEDDLKLLSVLFWTAGLLTGCGARSRRGFGAFTPSGELELPDGIDGSMFNSTADLKAALATARATALGEVEWQDRPVSPPDQSVTPVLGSDACLSVAGTPQTSAIDVLKGIGIKLREARAPVRLATRGLHAAHTDRVTREHLADKVDLFASGAFGLPAAVSRHAGLAKNGDRRASPLWLKPIQQIDETWRILAFVPHGRIFANGEASLVGRGFCATIDDASARQILHEFVGG